MVGVVLPHVFGTAPPSPPLPLSFLDDNFNALVAAVNTLLAGGGGTSVIGHVPIVNPQTGTTYTFQNTDSGNLVTGTNALAMAWTLPQSTGGFAAPWFVYAECLRTSTGAITITPTSSTIDGGTTLLIQPGGGAMIVADPAGNYQALRYTTKGQLTAGTTNTMNPWTGSTTASQAHGLSATPTKFDIYLQNLTAEGGYNIGDVAIPGQVVTNIGSGSVWTISADSANTYIATNNFSSVPSITNRSTGANFQITAANWKFVVTPYALL